MTTNDGGPAFPTPGSDLADVSAREGNGYGGMTLRDYFAGQVLTTLMTNSAIDGTNEDYAQIAYQVADAMIEARNRKDDDAPTTD